MVRKHDKLDSGGRLINVEFKHGKKMKKRRELDALVSNGKARRKTRSGHELLRNESDSSEIEEFSSPDTKISVRNRRGGSLCGTCLTVLAFLLLLACVVACAGLMWVHLELKTEIDTLRGRIQSAENSNQGVPAELESIKSQLQDWNKTLLGYRSGKQGLEEVIKNLTTVSQQVKLLQTLLTEIKKKMGQHPDESSMDGQNLAKSMADIGSDLETVKKQHAQLEDKTKKNIQKLEDRVAQLENQLKMMVMPSLPPTPAVASMNKEQTTELTLQLEQMQKELQTTNASLYGEINVIRQELSNHESQFEALESQSSKKPVSINTTAIMVNLRSELTTYIQSMLSNSSKSAAPVVPDSVLDTIKDEVKNISVAVGSLEQQINTEGSSADSVNMAKTLAVLHGHINSTDNNVQNLNNSVGKLETTVEKLMHLYVEEKNVIMNLTHNVHGILRYVDRLSGPQNTLNSDTTESNTTPAPQLDTQTTEGISETTRTENRRDTSNLKEELHEIFE
ncbi:EF-hand calcium-binding domain-containing protein 14-like isoform X1 [Liolophura sinensis]|uniref:EF-hand calcium-binding domain-containing protein 14-like isoform X1 n=1 Tax=Liolophura sinensis TaxID=3198878 RepID=UPI0031597618